MISHTSVHTAVWLRGSNVSGAASILMERKLTHRSASEASRKEEEEEACVWWRRLSGQHDAAAGTAAEPDGAPSGRRKSSDQVAQTQAVVGRAHVADMVSLAARLGPGAIRRQALFQGRYVSEISPAHPFLTVSSGWQDNNMICFGRHNDSDSGERALADAPCSGQ